MSESKTITSSERLERHNHLFRTGVTRDVNFRLQQLKNLKAAIKTSERELLTALWKDLHKSETEAYTTEIGILYSGINHAVRNLNKWVKPEKTGAPLTLFGTANRIYREPYGTVLIISPFNYPVNLVFEPLIGAIAAGNCAVINTSTLSPNVSAVVKTIIESTFDNGFISVVEGGKEITSQLVRLPFDCIFFTGGEKAGREVMKAAAENLVPVTLELGGKSPCIVDETADPDMAARKITWGKFTNAGQTCVAPDYLVVHRDVKHRLLECIGSYTRKFYGSDPKESGDFGRIISELHTERLGRLISRDKVITGGSVDIENKYVSPTLLKSDWNSLAMQDEIFGPVLPVIEFDDFQHVVDEIQKKPKPLALYLFSKNKTCIWKVLYEVSFGGGCINDVMVHAGNPGLPFGGVGASGMGAYHGKFSFLTFSHQKSVLDRKINIESEVMYPPYNGKKLSMIKKILK